MRVRRLALLCPIGALISVAVPLPAWQDVPTFRSTIQQVEVQVSVTDGRGRPVTDLTRDDFTVLEDGVPQTLSSFTVQVAGRADARAETTTRTSQDSTSLDDEREELRRSYVLIFDSAFLANQLRAPALAFIDRVMQPGDEAAVFAPPHNTYRPPTALPMLDDPGQVKARINGIVDEWEQNPPYHRVMKLPSLMLIGDAAALLNAMSGRRKAIVLFTAGTRLFWNDDPAMIETSILYRRVFENGIRMASLSGIPVHTVESSGLLPTDPTGRCVRVADHTRETLGAGPRVDSEENRLAQERLRAKQEVGPCDMQSSVRLFAEATGGVAIVNTNRFTDNYQRIRDFRWPTYILSYASPLTRHDGRYHAITVQVARPDVKVNATRGFYAFKPGGSTIPAATPPRSLSATVRAALDDDMPASNISVSVRAWAPAVGPLLVGATIADGDLPLDRRAPIELAFAAFDSDGILRAVRREVVRFPNRNNGPGAAAVTAYARLVAGAGSRVRVIASQANGRLGSGSAETFVRDDGAPLRTGDILVAASHPDDPVVVLEDEATRKVMSGFPTSRTTFAREESLTVAVDFLEMPVPTPGLTMLARLTSRDGVTLWSRRAVTQQTKRGSQGQFKTTLPLAGIQPGEYRLSFEASWTGTQTMAVSRDVALTVE